LKALKTYAKFFKKKAAYEEILSDIKPNALRELKKQPEGKADVDGIEFHVTNKTTKKYSEELTTQIKKLREDEEEAGKVKTSSTESFDASIPRSVKESVLSDVSDFKKHFDL